jgi:predicted PurR-regulated permease PerM
MLAPVTVRHEAPIRTILTVVAVLAGLWLLAQLWTLLALFIALLLTAALDPPVSRLERRGVPRLVSIAIIVLALAGLVAGALVLVVPPLVEQGTQFADALPGYLDRLQVFARANPELIARVQGAAGGGQNTPQAIASQFLAAGAGLFRGISAFLIVLVLTAYLLADGERIYDRTVRYLPHDQRVRIRQALPEISRVFSGYLLGQLLTSLLFGGFTYVVLTVLGVPQPLLLALLAAVADAIPVVGVVIATVPAVLLALTVSPLAAGIVLALYLAYQQVENYVSVPWVYQGTLELHPFAVLFAVLVGAQLLGVLGVLLALPIAAAVPVIERIWGGQSSSGPAGSLPRADADDLTQPETTRPNHAVPTDQTIVYQDQAPESGGENVNLRQSCRVGPPWNGQAAKRGRSAASLLKNGTDVPPGRQFSSARRLVR